MPATVPPLATLWSTYAAGDKKAVAHQIGGQVATQITTAHWDTCAIRVSRSLNYSGAPIPPGGGGYNNPYQNDRKIRTIQGGDGMRYVYSTGDLMAYLTGRYGQPARFKGTTKGPEVAGYQGIIFFSFTHVDLWNGKQCVGYLPEGFFGECTVGGGEILIWQAP
jgi:hypothetical protein